MNSTVPPRKREVGREQIVGSFDRSTNQNNASIAARPSIPSLLCRHFFLIISLVPSHPRSLQTPTNAAFPSGELRALSPRCFFFFLSTERGSNAMLHPTSSRRSCKHRRRIDESTQRSPPKDCLFVSRCVSERAHNSRKIRARF